MCARPIARTHAEVGLTRLLQRIESQDQVELVVRAVRHPGVGVGVVRAWFVENGQRLAMARRPSLRDEQRDGCDYSRKKSFHRSSLLKWGSGRCTTLQAERTYAGRVLNPSNPNARAARNCLVYDVARRPKWKKRR